MTWNQTTMKLFDLTKWQRKVRNRADSISVASPEAAILFTVMNCPQRASRSPMPLLAKKIKSVQYRFQKRFVWTYCPWLEEAAKTLKAGRADPSWKNNDSPWQQNALRAWEDCS